MLELQNISAIYGKTPALWDVCLEVNELEIVALIGSNGAGKTTLLGTISGCVQPTSGQVLFLRKRIDGLPPHSIAELGISHVPEGGKVFPEMTVRENLDIGAYTANARDEKAETLRQVYDSFPRLKERDSQLASTLSGGERQMLAIGRGLMSRPRLCLLDEPSYGLSPLMVKEIFSIIKGLRDHDITVLLVEQNAQQALEIADRAYVLENGRLCLQGSCENLLASDYVKRAYLGL
jgi:branched-chain amino acid transport system ATP-binding protein